jgi:hypothetical protein
MREPRAVYQFNVHLTKQERLYIKRRAGANRLPEADYLRMCVLVEGVMEHDAEAWLMMVGRVKALVTERLRQALGQTELPVRASR